MKTKLLFISLVVLCQLGFIVVADEVNATSNSARAFSRDCSKSYSTTCMKLDVVSFVEKLSETENYSILPGVSMIREKDAVVPKTSEMVAELARDFPNDAEARLDAFLLKKVEGYLNTHSLRFKLLDQKSIDAARYLVDSTTGRGKKNKGMGQALMAGILMVKGTLLPIAMGTLAMMAGKALMTGLLSLMLSAIIGLKALTSGGHKSTTYEIVSKPVYTSSHTHSTAHEDHGAYGYGGHGRSYDINGQLNGQLTAQQPPVQFTLPASVVLKPVN